MSEILPPGRLEAIYLAPKAGALMTPIDSVRAVPGRGLEGDRYFHGAGSFSRWPAPHRDVTLISVEALDEMAAATGVRLAPIESRRNLLVSGLPLADLLKTRIRIGTVELEILRLCSPCKYLARKTGIEGLLKALSGRGGVRARVDREGVLSTGDIVIPLG